MIGKIILACILLLIIFIAWKVWHTCKTGQAHGILGNLFAKPCHLIFRV